MERAVRFGQWYRREHPAVLRFLRRRVATDRAEDIAHEAFLVAWRRFDDVPSDPGSARAWLLTVARNCLLNDQRGVHRRDALAVRISEDARGFVPAPDGEVHTRLDLATAWGSLTPREQEALSLTAWDGLTSAEAARVFGISAPAFRVRLHRARSALRTALEAPSPATGVVPKLLPTKAPNSAGPTPPKDRP